jgi:hypothetical protein
LKQIEIVRAIFVDEQKAINVNFGKVYNKKKQRINVDWGRGYGKTFLLG